MGPRTAWWEVHTESFLFLDGRSRGSMRAPTKSGVWRVPPGYRRLSFVSFVEARQAALLCRRQGKPPADWTEDEVLRNAKFCNIDRRDDAVTAELLTALEAAPKWQLRERVLLAASLRFTGSRRGEASILAGLIEAGLHVDADGNDTPLRAALRRGEVRCGSGTYQMSLNRTQIATVIERTADAVVAHVHANGQFRDVLEAADFVAEQMTVGKRPQFSANETAKDFAYIAGLMQSLSHRRCHLGPGARKGLVLVRSQQAQLHGLSEDEAVECLCGQLRERHSLAWIETIDVEQALCEFSKYEAYVANGVSSVKQYRPALGLAAAPAEGSKCKA